MDVWRGIKIIPMHTPRTLLCQDQAPPPPPGFEIPVSTTDMFYAGL